LNNRFLGAQKIFSAWRASWICSTKWKLLYYCPFYWRNSQAIYDSPKVDLKSDSFLYECLLLELHLVMRVSQEAFKRAIKEFSIKRN
jgi:hypothetical protein